MKNSFKLFEEIIKLSNSSVQENAKDEQELEKIQHSEGANCICGKDIIECHKIVNKFNTNRCIVGSECIKKFERNDLDMSKVFKDVRKLKKDNLKSLSNESLDLIKDNNIINDQEYDFYHNIKSKRVITLKQETIKLKLNNKFLKFILKNHT